MAGSYIVLQIRLKLNTKAIIRSVRVTLPAVMAVDDEPSLEVAFVHKNQLYKKGELMLVSVWSAVSNCFVLLGPSLVNMFHLCPAYTIKM